MHIHYTEFTRLGNIVNCLKNNTNYIQFIYVVNDFILHNLGVYCDGTRIKTMIISKNGIFMEGFHFYIILIAR